MQLSIQVNLSFVYFCIIIEIYRLIWAIIFDLWNISEEKNQLNDNIELKHKLSDEFDIFGKFAALYMEKLEKIEKFEKKKTMEFEFEQNLDKMAKNANLIERIKEKVKESS